MNDTVKDDVATLIEQMSEPQEHAIAQEQERQAETAGDVDAAGESYNQAIHATGFDGKGVKTAKGLWRKRRGAAGTGGIHRSVVGVPSQAGATGTGVSGVDTTTEAARSAGVAAANTVLMFGRALGGEEWAPIVNEKENEQAMMEKAWGDYFVAKKVTDFPPGIALSVCCAGYAMRRLTMPQTQTRMQRFKEWAGEKIGRWKMRRQARRQGLPEQP